MYEHKFFVYYYINVKINKSFNIIKIHFFIHKKKSFSFNNLKFTIELFTISFVITL